MAVRASTNVASAARTYRSPARVEWCEGRVVSVPARHGVSTARSLIVSQSRSPASHRPSALWLWGFWVYIGSAFVVIAIAFHFATPADRLLRGTGGVLCLLAGRHGLRVEAYKRAVRGPHTVWGFDSYLAQRQTGWSAMVLGAVLVASAWFGL